MLVFKPRIFITPLNMSQLLWFNRLADALIQKLSDLSLGIRLWVQRKGFSKIYCLRSDDRLENDLGTVQVPAIFYEVI